MPCHDWNCSILSDEKPTAFSTRKPKKNQTLVDHHVNPKNLQVHMTDQVMLPPLWNSFVGTGIHNGPVPPALCYKFYVYWDGPHTHPAKAGLVQYASYTTKCPGTTSGLSGKPATHNGVQALPPVGKGPAHKMVNARPKEWRNTFRWQSSYTTSVQELPPPACQLHDKASRHCGKFKKPERNRQSWHDAVLLKGSRPCHIRFRLVTAVNLTTNWCTSEPYQITKKKKSNL